jgi:hypothetical protein
MSQAMISADDEWQLREHSADLGTRAGILRAIRRPVEGRPPGIPRRGSFCPVSTALRRVTSILRRCTYRLSGPSGGGSPWRNTCLQLKKLLGLRQTETLIRPSRRFFATLVCRRLMRQPVCGYGVARRVGDLDQRPCIGIPGTTVVRFAWCNVRPTAVRVPIYYHNPPDFR